ncbi:hypothetical protein Cassandra_0486 [Pseudomonas phage Cassandra]|nr:hypothetical protein Cassandra_0486 [Pseudomonas phage Cassandra]WPK39674.1 hypothetical protein Deiofobo_0477 [Pseudomonas phage Deifobo]WPK40710.1 hypothetical protein Paride_0480 [Pseudomonas phage Paride]
MQTKNADGGVCLKYDIVISNIHIHYYPCQIALPRRKGPISDHTRSMSALRLPIAVCNSPYSAWYICKCIAYTTNYITPS